MKITNLYLTAQKVTDNGIVTLLLTNCTSTYL